MLTDLEKRALLLWSSVDGAGSQTLRALVRWSRTNHVSLDELWRSPSTLPKLAQREQILLNHAQVTKQYTLQSYPEWLQHQSIHWVFEHDDAYPVLLKQCQRHPYILYYRGAVDGLNHPLPIAVVGTRQITAYGTQATQQLTHDLVCAGAQIISGFMYGVDVTAHQTALANRGSTVAVLGFGLQHMYPKSHTRMAQQLVAAGGVLVSPFAPQVEARAGNFPARNAIVAGMSRAVVVTEAAEKSGSLITAKRAIEEGRAVCAVSGPFDSMYAVGTKWLINQGATLVTSARDILQEVGALPTEHQFAEQQSEESTPAQLSHKPELRQLYQLISLTQPTTDELVNAVAISVTTVTEQLTDLELSGLIERSGNRWITVQH